MEVGRALVWVVEDDLAVQEVLSTVLDRAGYEVMCFADGPSLMAAVSTARPACVLLDVKLPGMSGLEVLKGLNGEDYQAPIIIMSGQGDIVMAVDAIKNGAHDFIEKPFGGKEVVARIAEAIEAFGRRIAALRSETPPMHFPGREPLSRREQEVIKLITSGITNKEAGFQLGISPRTVEFHRANAMKKLGAKNAADLLRIVLA